MAQLQEVRETRQVERGSHRCADGNVDHDGPRCGIQFSSMDCRVVGSIGSHAGSRAGIWRQRARKRARPNLKRRPSASRSDSRQWGVPLFLSRTRSVPDVVVIAVAAVLMLGVAVRGVQAAFVPAAPVAAPFCGSIAAGLLPHSAIASEQVVVVEADVEPVALRRTYLRYGAGAKVYFTTLLVPGATLSATPGQRFSAQLYWSGLGLDPGVDLKEDGADAVISDTRASCVSLHKTSGAAAVALNCSGGTHYMVSINHGAPFGESDTKERDIFVQLSSYPQLAAVALDQQLQALNSTWYDLENADVCGDDPSTRGVLVEFQFATGAFADSPSREAGEWLYASATNGDRGIERVVFQVSLLLLTLPFFFAYAIGMCCHCRMFGTFDPALSSASPDQPDGCNGCCLRCYTRPVVLFSATCGSLFRRGRLGAANKRRQQAFDALVHGRNPAPTPAGASAAATLTKTDRAKQAATAVHKHGAHAPVRSCGGGVPQLVGVCLIRVVSSVTSVVVLWKSLFSAPGLRIGFSVPNLLAADFGFLQWLLDFGMWLTALPVFDFGLSSVISAGCLEGMITGSALTFMFVCTVLIPLYGFRAIGRTRARVKGLAISFPDNKLLAFVPPIVFNFVTFWFQVLFTTMSGQWPVIGAMYPESAQVVTGKQMNSFLDQVFPCADGYGINGFLGVGKNLAGVVMPYVLVPIFVAQVVFIISGALHEHSRGDRVKTEGAPRSFGRRAARTIGLSIAQPLCMAVGIWPAWMVRTFPICQEAAKLNFTPGSPTRNNHLATLQGIAVSQSVLWYLFPGGALLAKLIEHSNRTPLYVDNTYKHRFYLTDSSGENRVLSLEHEQSVNLQVKPAVRVSQYVANMANVLFLLVTVLTASPAWLAILLMSAIATAVVEHMVGQPDGAGFSEAAVPRLLWQCPWGDPLGVGAKASSSAELTMNPLHRQGTASQSESTA